MFAIARQKYLGSHLAGLIILLFFSGFAQAAATLCVDPLGVAAPTTNQCYALPSQAVAAAANDDTILIHAGTYMEPAAITITQTGLKIIGDSPANTAVKNAVAESVFILQSNSGASAEIANLTITGGMHGIDVGAWNGQVIIHHNRIENNGQNGILGSSSSSLIIAYNNIVQFNNAYGIRAGNSNDVIYNNIVKGNGYRGIASGSASYNSSYGNAGGDYYLISGNIGNISTDCLFVNEAANDYRLQSGSPCKDTGNPGYQDVDGTVSDMGIYGGPGAALFWPYGNGGPVVTNLTIDPPIVPEGGPLTIKATIEVR